MDCTKAQNLIDAYIDGELDAATVVDFEAHLSDCPVCQNKLAELERLRKLVHARPRYFRAPADVAARIEKQIGTPSQPNRSNRMQIRDFLWPLATAAVLMIAIFTYVSRSDTNALVDEIVSNHVRSLLADHLVDVVSSDKHTVHPWFAGKLDYSPTVTDFTAQGFPLEGGRLDYLNGQPVAALVYAHMKHHINVFVMPSASSPSATPTTLSRRGFSLLHWNNQGMSYYAISDAEESALHELRRLMTESIDEPGTSPASRLVL